jgi:hypothetical protein
MVFDPSIQGLKCEFCGSDKAIRSDKTLAVEKDLFKAPRDKGWEVPVKTSKCDGCGATISSPGQITGECPFCGSKYVKEISEHQNIIRPENMVPFRIPKDKAEGLFDEWIGKGWFRPNDLKNLKKLENIKGIYLPFWTYDCSTFSTWTAMSGYYYYETETYRTRENGRWVTRTRQVRKTRWEPSSGSRNGSYDDVLIIASRGLDKKLVEKIYPYRLGELVPYKPDYLSGWPAEEYSVGVEEGWSEARSKVMKEEESKCSRDVPGDTHRALNVNTTFSNMTYKHILLPIWTASYHYKEKLYHFLINGQTGEVQGYKPWSWIKIGIAIAAGVALALLIGAAIYFM